MEKHKLSASLVGGSDRFHVRVFLEKIRVLDDRDPLWCGQGEIRFLCRVTPGKDPGRTQSMRLPTTGVYQMEPGEQVIERYIFDGDLNPSDPLEIEICGVEEDWLSPDDPLTRYRRSFTGNPKSWVKSYGPGDEIGDAEALADWELWYRIEAEALPSVLDLLPKDPVDTPGVPGPLRRMALFIRERADVSGLVPLDLWRRAQTHKKQMRRTDPREDDPGGTAPTEDLRASIHSDEPIVLKLRAAEDPGTVSSFGNVGRFVRVEADGSFRDATLKIGLTPAEANQVNPVSLRIFRYDEQRKSFQLVSRSGLGNEGSYVWGRIRKPGIYGVFGLPRDQARLLTLQALRLSQSLAELYRSLSGTDRPFIERICQLILCPPFTGLSDILINPDELDKLGFEDWVGDARLLEGDIFGPIPRDEKGHPIGSRPVKGRNPGFKLPGIRQGGNICEQCFGLKGFDLPEIDIPKGGYGIPATTCEKWVSMGPTNLAGRVKSLTIHPTNGNIVYAGVSEGGVFKSTDGGNTWFPTMEGELSLAIGAVAVASSSPDVVYAGTGEYISAGWIAATTYPGVGVYRSTNGGMDWDLMPPFESDGISRVSDRISRILVHPTNPDRVYVAGNKGIHRWNQSTGDWTRIATADTSDIVLDAANPQRLFAGMEGASGIHVTNNAEAANPTWQPFNTGITLPTHWPNPNFIKLAISPSNPVVMYARVNHEVETSPGEWNVDGATTYRWNGVTWQDKGIHGGGTQRIWCSYVRVHPTDPNRIYVGGVGMAWSPDGGNTWYNLGAGHADNHDLVFDPAKLDRTIIANDGGVWQHIQSPTETTWNYADSNAKLVTIQFYKVGVSQKGPFTIGGSTQDQGILVAHGSMNYDGLGGNEGGLFEVDPNNGNTIYWDPWSGNLTRTDSGSASGQRDANNGIERLLDNNGNPTRVPSINSLAIHPGDSNVLICSAAGQGNTHRIYRSLDGAAPAPATGWVQVLSNAGSSVEKIVFAPGDPTWVYAITAAGLVYRSTNTGATWIRMSNTTLPAGFLRGLAVDWDDKLTVYVTYGGSGLAFGHVWASVDGGENWHDISDVKPYSRLPDIYTNTIVVHKGKPETLYVCTDIGVFRTQDGGDWWYPFDEGLPNAITSDMDYQPLAQALYVSTVGRGMYKRLL